MPTIQINFHTKKLGPWAKAYEKAILEYLRPHFAGRNDLAMEMNQWVINVYSTEDADRRFFYGSGARMRGGVPHGNTGKRKVDLYLYDSPGDRALMMNMQTAIDHELAHMVLCIYDPERKEKLKYSEVGVGYGKKGDIRKWWSGEVHDREFVTRNGDATYLRKMHILYNGKKIPFQVMEIRDITIDSPRYRK